MLRLWILFEILALIAAYFGFGAVASTFHDLAKLSFFLGPFVDIGKLVLFRNS